MQFTIKLMGAIFALMLSFSAHAQEQEMPTAQVTELGDNVYSVILAGYNSLVVIGDNDVLIVDPGLSERVALFKPELAKLTDKPVSKVVLSHEHYDHVGGANDFEGAEIIAHIAGIEDLELDVLGIGAKVDTTFDKFMSIDLGGKIVELHHWAPGDGDGVAVVYVPEAKVVSTSDLYEDSALTPTVFIQDTNFLGIRHILNKIAEMDLEYAISSHSTSMDVQNLIDARDYYNDLYQAFADHVMPILEEQGIQAAFGAGQELINTLQLPKYKDWENYETDLRGHAERMFQAFFHGG